MSSIILLLALSASLAFVALAQVKDMPTDAFDSFARPNCYKQCKFRMCNNPAVIHVGKGLGVPPAIEAICGITTLPKFIGEIGKTGEAIYAGEVTNPTSADFVDGPTDLGPGYALRQWHPPGLRQYFAPSFFKAGHLPRTFETCCTPSSPSGNTVKLSKSFVTHQAPESNQRDYLHNKCWILPILNYQTYSARGFAINNRGKNSTSDCIAFVTVTK